MKKPKKRTTKRLAGKTAPSAQSRTVSAQPKKPSSFSGEALKWGGAALIALSIIGGIQTAVALSPWATWFLENWTQLSTAGVSYLFSFFGLTIGADAVIPFLFVVGMLGLAFSAADLEHNELAENSFPPKNAKLSRVFLSEEYHFRLNEGMVIGVLVAIILLVFGHYYLFDKRFAPSDLVFPWVAGLILILAMAALGVIIYSRSWIELLHMFLLTIFMSALYIAMLLPASSHARSMGNHELWSFAFMVVNLSIFWLPFKLMSLIAIARPRYWNHRFVFVWCTVATLLALDWLSRNALPRIS